MKNEILSILIKYYPNFANNERVAKEIESLLNPPILMTPVISSQINSIGWSNKTLYIEFHKGEVYTYTDVPEDHYKALLIPDPHHSVGQYFVNHIKGKYEYVKTDKKVVKGELK